MKPIYEIIGPDNKVHYRRPEGHPDIAEAVATEGYSVRLEDPVAEEERNARFADILIQDMQQSECLAKADDKKLLWLIINMLEEWRGQQHVMGVNLAILDQLENRLYPEYDGENVRMTDTGWITPDGPVDYIKP